MTPLWDRAPSLWRSLQMAFSALSSPSHRWKVLKKKGCPRELFPSFFERLKTVKLPLFFLFLTGACLLLPGLALPGFIRIFVDNVLVSYATGPAQLLLSRSFLSGFDWWLIDLDAKLHVKPFKYASLRPIFESISLAFIAPSRPLLQQRFSRDRLSLKFK